MPFVTLPPGNHDVLSGVSADDHHVDPRSLMEDSGDGLSSSGVGNLTKVPVATQVEMEAGLLGSIRMLTPGLVGASIAALRHRLEMVRSGNIASNAVAVTWPAAFASAPSVVTSYFTTSTASRHSHAKTSSTTGATCFGNENAEPLDVFAMETT